MLVKPLVMFNGALGVVIVILIGYAIWPERPPQPKRPSTAQPTQVVPPRAESIREEPKTKGPPETALAELDRLRTEEARRFLAIIRHDSTEAKHLRELAEQGIFISSHPNRLREEMQRNYEDARNRRLNFESQLRTQYGELPERPPISVD